MPFASVSRLYTQEMDDEKSDETLQQPNADDDGDHRPPPPLHLLRIVHDLAAAIADALHDSSATILPLLQSSHGLHEQMRAIARVNANAMSIMQQFPELNQRLSAAIAVNLSEKLRQLGDLAQTHRKAHRTATRKFERAKAACFDDAHCLASASSMSIPAIVAALDALICALGSFVDALEWPPSDAAQLPLALADSSKTKLDEKRRRVVEAGERLALLQQQHVTLFYSACFNLTDEKSKRRSDK